MDQPHKASRGVSCSNTGIIFVRNEALHLIKISPVIIHDEVAVSPPMRCILGNAMRRGTLVASVPSVAGISELTGRSGADNLSD